MGDVTSGGVQDDAAANADISGGGGGGSSSNYSYSDLGQSPGAMGGRPDPTPVPVVQSSNDYFTPMNDQPISGQCLLTLSAVIYKIWVKIFLAVAHRPMTEDHRVRM